MAHSPPAARLADMLLLTFNRERMSDKGSMFLGFGLLGMIYRTLLHGLSRKSKLPPNLGTSDRQALVTTQRAE
jgi:hypothetical protein